MPVNKTIKTKIVIRNDVASAWTTANPTLLRGEMGYESDTGKFKFGDGTLAWNSLDYSSASGGKVIEVTNLDGAYASDSAALATIDSEDVEIGYIAVVITKQTVNSVEVIINKSAYQWGPTGVSDTAQWVAIDGNVDASKVILNDDILMAGSYTQVGNKTKSSSGTETFATKGLSVQDALTEIFTKRLQPSKTNPSVTVTIAGTNATESSYEIGTVMSPTYAVTFEDGSYTYSSATGSTATAYSVSDTYSNTGSTATGSMGSVTLGTTAYKVSASADYTAGNIAKDNIGSDSNPVVQITAGTTSTASSRQITSYRNIFYGYSDITSISDITSAVVRALSLKKPSTAGELTTLAEDTSKASIIVAAPTGRTLSQVVMPSSLNADATALFVNSGTVSVEGANGYTGINYTIWIYHPAKMEGTYKITMG